MASCTQAAAALNTIACFSIGCRNGVDNDLLYLKSLFTVSWRARTVFDCSLSYLNDWLLGVEHCGLNLYALSACTISRPVNSLLRPSANIDGSGNIPHGKGPLIQHISPVRIFSAISYRKPAPLNLWLNHFVLHGLRGSLIGQSVPSTDSLMIFPTSSLNLSSKQIYSAGDFYTMLSAVVCEK